MKKTNLKLLEDFLKTADDNPLILSDIELEKLRILILENDALEPLHIVQ